MYVITVTVTDNLFKHCPALPLRVQTITPTCVYAFMRLWGGLIYLFRAPLHEVYMYTDDVYVCTSYVYGHVCVYNMSLSLMNNLFKH